MFTFTSSDGLEIHVHAWQPVGPPRGVVQLAHGMGEHASRYGRLAGALTAQGYAVYAADHRGHGRSSAGTPGHLGEDGWNRLVQDQVALSDLVRVRHPGLPLVLVGHSLGSLASQQYILDHSERLAGVALSGTTALDRLLTVLAAAGGDATTAFNASFEPARTSHDWLSRDEDQVDAYLADPLCGAALDARAMEDLAAAAHRLARPETVRPDLPVYVAVGDRDPFNAELTLSDVVVERYRQAGLTDVTYRTYRGARHGILHETNRTEVAAELVAWILCVTG
ncbi:alpha-beta hydrolase superfamily lysophospholipase [Streptomyces sp. TLI_235]|nr:alpha/beta fold hydrolase [Streptomyces sp. TLI_235]PBC66193.1 alpha-beta hydrolase superfamily lysophospholipase [Streptomyces sp. TLI_235]